MEHTQEMIRELQGEVSCTLWQLDRYFLKLGTVGFGGPVALVGSLRRDLVESRKWISETDYQEGLALAQFSPGPLAALLAMDVGYVRSRRLGATAVGLAFIWPLFWGKYLLHAVVFGSSSPCQADRSAQDDSLHASALQRAADPGGLCTDLSAGSSAAPGSLSTFTHGCAYAPGVYDGVDLPSGAASVASLARSVGSAISPVIFGLLLQGPVLVLGASFIVAGTRKATYDGALWLLLRHVQVEDRTELPTDRASTASSERGARERGNEQ